MPSTPASASVLVLILRPTRLVCRCPRTRTRCPRSRLIPSHDSARLRRRWRRPRTPPPSPPGSPPVRSAEGRLALVQSRPPRSSHHARGRASPVPPPPPACLSCRFRASPEVCQPSLPPCSECLLPLLFDSSLSQQKNWQREARGGKQGATYSSCPPHGGRNEVGEECAGDWETKVKQDRTRKPEDTANPARESTQPAPERKKGGPAEIRAP